MFIDKFCQMKCLCFSDKAIYARIHKTWSGYDRYMVCKFIIDLSKISMLITYIECRVNNVYFVLFIDTLINNSWQP